MRLRTRPEWPGRRRRAAWGTISTRPINDGSAGGLSLVAGDVLTLGVGPDRNEEGQRLADESLDDGNDQVAAGVVDAARAQRHEQRAGEADTEVERQHDGNAETGAKEAGRGGT